MMPGLSSGYLYSLGLVFTSMFVVKFLIRIIVFKRIHILQLYFFFDHTALVDKKYSCKLLLCLISQVEKY